MYIRRLPLEGVWTVYAACSDRGDCQFLEFLEGLGPNLEAAGDKLLALLEHVAQNGPRLNTNLSHQLRGDIYEFIKGRIRVLYFCERGRIIVCTHALIKKKQEIGNAEINRAEEVMKTYRDALQRGTIEVLDDANDEDDDNGE